MRSATTRNTPGWILTKLSWRLELSVLRPCRCLLLLSMASLGLAKPTVGTNTHFNNHGNKRCHGHSNFPGSNSGGGGSSNTGGQASNCLSSTPWFPGFNPWTSMIQAWPMHVVTHFRSPRPQSTTGCASAGILDHLATSNSCTGACSTTLHRRRLELASAHGCSSHGQSPPRRTPSLRMVPGHQRHLSYDFWLR